MVEVDKEYASKGVGNTALGLSIGAVGAELLGGTLGNLLGGNRGCEHNHYVDRYEAGMAAKISELETEVKLRDANSYTLGEINKVRDYVDRRFERVECQLNQQAVYNATNTAALNCMQGQIAQLMGLTKIVVPNSSVCPGWGDVTVSVTPATTA